MGIIVTRKKKGQLGMTRKTYLILPQSLHLPILLLNLIRIILDRILNMKQSPQKSMRNHLVLPHQNRIESVPPLASAQHKRERVDVLDQNKPPQTSQPQPSVL